jgi:RPA family protein
MKKLIGYILLFSNLSFLLPIESHSQTNICPKVDFVTAKVESFYQEQNKCHYINIEDVQKINDVNDRKFRVPIYSQSLDRINTEFNIYQVNCNENEYRLIKSTIWQRGQVIQNIEKVSSSFTRPSTLLFQNSVYYTCTLMK